MFAITIFNITDTFFVSRLGTDALAAIGFTVPVVMVTGSLSMAMAMGAGSVPARAMGRGDHHLMAGIATDGILLAALTVLVVSSVGMLSVEPLFRALGAVAFIMPPVGDSAIRQCARWAWPVHRRRR